MRAAAKRKCLKLGCQRIRTIKREEGAKLLLAIVLVREGRKMEGTKMEGVAQEMVGKVR